MDAEHLVVHQRREVEVVEDVDAVLPRVGVPVLAHALLIKPVHLSGRGVLCRPRLARRAPPKKVYKGESTSADYFIELERERRQAGGRAQKADADTPADDGRNERRHRKQKVQ